ncbi:MAG: FGGY family carbohydrate kinase, partial [Candidatus Limnocylindrales bacterium]
MSVLAYDIGTSGIKAVVADLDGRVLASARRGYGLTTLDDGAVEQDLDAIEAALVEATRELLADRRVAADTIDGIGLTAQMFDLAPVDAGGRSTVPMLSWLDQRAVREAAALGVAMDRASQARAFGSVLTAKDVVPKILWLRDRAPAAWAGTRWLLDCKEAIVLRRTGRAV